MTWEEAVEWFRSQPCNAEGVKANYFDRDFVGAARRFAASDEFEETMRLFSAHNKNAGTRLLEIGAGAGIASYAFWTRGFDVTALEPDSSDTVGAGAIKKLASTTGAAIAVVQNWGEGLPFDAGVFDAVYVRQVLHHAHDLPLLCAEAARVLRPRGLFLAVREHVIRTPDDLQEFLDSHPLHHLYGGEHAYTLEEYGSAIISAGFRLTNVLGPADSPINFYPATNAEILQRGFETLLARAGVRRGANALWRHGGGALVKLIPAFQRVCRNAIRTSFGPGSIFSFVAVKQ